MCMFMFISMKIMMEQSKNWGLSFAQSILSNKCVRKKLKRHLKVRFCCCVVFFFPTSVRILYICVVQAQLKF